MKKITFICCVPFFVMSGLIILEAPGTVEEGRLMTKKTLKTFSFLSGLFLLWLIVPQGAHASSSAFTSIGYPGMTATVLQGINDGGQIVGYYFDSFDNATTRFHSILATPVPELVTMLLLGSVLIGLWGRGRKFRN
jgi:hypothetical protein